MKKNNYFQLIRGICILMVIIIHTLYLTNISTYDYSNIVIRKIVNFTVGVFIFISGYFLNIKHDTRDLYKKKVKRLLIPLIVWNLIYSIIFNITKHESLISIIISLLLSSKGFHLYYLYALLELVIISPLLIKWFNKYKNTKLVFLPLLISPISNLIYSILSLNITSNFFKLYKYVFIAWVSYYYLGIIFRNIKYEFNQRKHMYIYNIINIKYIRRFISI